MKAWLIWLVKMILMIKPEDIFPDHKKEPVITHVDVERWTQIEPVDVDDPEYVARLGKIANDKYFRWFLFEVESTMRDKVKLGEGNVMHQSGALWGVGFIRETLCMMASRTPKE